MERDIEKEKENDNNYINLQNLKSDYEHLMQKYATLLENNNDKNNDLHVKKTTNVSKAFKDLKKSREINRKKM